TRAGMNGAKAMRETMSAGAMPPARTSMIRVETKTYVVPTGHGGNRGRNRHHRRHQLHLCPRWRGSSGGWSAEDRKHSAPRSSSDQILIQPVIGQQNGARNNSCPSTPTG